MLRVYPEQLSLKLQSGLRACYILHGNEPFLLEEAQNTIFTVAQQQGFTEHFIITLDHQTNWHYIFSICQSFSLLGTRQILLLILPEPGPTAIMHAQLATLATFLHRDVLLILKMKSLTKIHEKSNWYKALCIHGVDIPCHQLNANKLSLWITSRARLLNIDIDDTVNQLLCYYYEGNLLALSQILEQIRIFFSNRPLTRNHVEKLVHDSAHFNIFEWIDSLLLGDSKRAMHILQQISAENSISITLLLHILQRNLLLLITITLQTVHTPVDTLFNQYRVLDKRRIIFKIALKRLQHAQWFRIFRLLMNIELIMKQHDNQPLWLELEMLTIICCHKNCPLSIDEVEISDTFCI
ncbi:DNA polymerase III subunit delta [Candidatus Erwinia haradaeae]|uniref:DNA polymerase III subunit delta n=1 Tax=Candidatus Erwinia haradaeae TaxID=1922217 RepID=A0A451D9R7_9GAMM|nr:DNA polymerase III subunit delta [Candidatus Erwinia haradaeae]VFP83061.1 DNA polymerase III subunit delta [Candidatus Erwinia haradaeae]